MKRPRNLTGRVADLTTAIAMSVAMPVVATWITGRLCFYVLGLAAHEAVDVVREMLTREAHPPARKTNPHVWN